MTQRVKDPVAKSEDLSSIPRTPYGERKGTIPAVDGTQAPSQAESVRCNFTKPAPKQANKQTLTQS